ncbi:histidinolphosphatase, partial [Ceratobasidium sp. 392]
MLRSFGRVGGGNPVGEADLDEKVVVDGYDGASGEVWEEPPGEGAVGEALVGAELAEPVHGAFCKHAVGTLEDVVKGAVKRGFKVYGLTEHVPRYRREDMYPEEADLDPSDLARTFDLYIQEAHRLKIAYADQITLLVGLETDFITPTDLDQLETLLARYGDKIEYVVGSIHHCNGIPLDFDKPTFEKALIKSLGGTFVLSDDSHGPAAVGLNYDRLLAYVEEMGIENVAHLERTDQKNKAGRQVHPVF